MKCPLCDETMLSIFATPNVRECINGKCKAFGRDLPVWFLRAIRRKLKAKYERGRKDGHADTYMGR